MHVVIDVYKFGQEFFIIGIFWNFFYNYLKSILAKKHKIHFGCMQKVICSLNMQIKRALVIWIEQYAPYIQNLPRPARKDSKVCIEKLKNTIGLTVESIYYGQHPTDVMYG